MRLKQLRRRRLDSIHSRIVAFAVTATLLPAGIALWISYAQNRAAVEAHTAEELRSESAQTARELAVWLRERLYEMRVFASSNEVYDNVERLALPGDSFPRDRLREYLGSVNDRFSDIDQLFALDVSGRPVASSGTHDAEPVQLPSDWLGTLRAHNQVIGNAYWDEKAGKARLALAVPVWRPDGRRVGALAAELNLGAVREVLRSFASDSTSAVYLLDSHGDFIASSRGISAQLVNSKLDNLAQLLRGEGQALSYLNRTGTPVIGTLKRVPGVEWGVLVETPSQVAFSRVERFRNVALLVIVALLFGAAIGAYRFGLIIVRPLDRLTKAAAGVAAGDLSIELPPAGGGEVGYLTTVFGHMISRLREARAELERLSLTDGLTALSNRRFLLQRLADETARHLRSRREYAVLMADVDHFKKYNDTFGHPAGDEVLQKLAIILRQCVREIDGVARYGGEEFCLILPETNASGAAVVAERIRVDVAAAEFGGQSITVSIGVAAFPKDGDTADDVIAAADEALYEAKRRGRNQVVQARKGKKQKRAAAS